MKDQFIRMNIKDNKSDNKNTTNEFRYFFESHFVRVNRLCVLVYTNEAKDAKKFNAGKYQLPKGIIKNHNVIINGKKVYGQTCDSDIKRYEEIRKLTIAEDEDYTTGFLLYYAYIKNRYRLIAVDLRRPKELDADPKTIQRIKIARGLIKTRWQQQCYKCK